MIHHHKARLGSISTGTLRTEDLLSSFAYELKHIAQDGAFASLIADAEAWPENEEIDSILVNELIEALNSYAPPYTYFGSLEGDGADFGFWPAWDAIDELPHVQDEDEAKALGEDCKFVNDHGNVTIFAADGSVIWDCV